MLKTNLLDIENELKDEINLFYSKNDFLKIDHYFKADDMQMYCSVLIDDKKFEFSSSFPDGDSLVQKRLIKRFNKQSIYDALSLYTGLSMPWGSLTGIRPTRLAYDLINNGTKKDDLVFKLIDLFKISEKRAKLIKEIIEVQSNLSFSKSAINLYVHIPFCPSRCNYCSFVSTSIDKQKNLIAPYIDCLEKEIELSKKIIQEKGLTIDSIYVGGGTPTSIDDESFFRILKSIKAKGIELTCEAGRPDTITEKKLDIMKECGVTRVCINTQTLNDNTLKSIGRNHTSEQFFTAYNLAWQRGFDINVDLICGLDKETVQDFIASLSGITGLMPQNLTVHTLSIKRGALLAEREQSKNLEAESMVNYAIDELNKYIYKPYYLYRQKQMSSNLENIGYCLNGKACRNNISTMEETLPVMANGAGAISKRLFANGRIERLANPKDIKLYIEDFDERMNKKHLFFKN